MPKKVIFVKWYEKGRSVVESAITFNLTAEIVLKKFWKWPSKSRY